MCLTLQNQTEASSIFRTFKALEFWIWFFWFLALFPILSFTFAERFKLWPLWSLYPFTQCIISIDDGILDTLILSFRLESNHLSFNQREWICTEQELWRQLFNFHFSHHADITRLWYIVLIRFVTYFGCTSGIHSWFIYWFWPFWHVRTALRFTLFCVLLVVEVSTGFVLLGLSFVALFLFTSRGFRVSFFSFWFMYRTCLSPSFNVFLKLSFVL